MPVPGDVYFHTKFKFLDGTFGEKLLIVLNKTDVVTECLVLKTTKNPKRYTNAKPGCNPELKCFFIPKEWQCFNVDTYVQLPQIFSIPISELISGGINKIIEKKFTLNEDCFRVLRNCLRKNFKKDISPHYWKLIFNK